MRRMMSHDIVERLAVGIYFARLDRFVKLRRIALDRLELRFELIGDVHNERRLDVVFAICKTVHNLSRPEYGNVRLDLLQTCYEAPIANQLRADGVIRVLSVRRWSYHDSWREATNRHCQLRARFRRVDDSTVR